MLKKDKKGIFAFEDLKKESAILHGFSSKKFKDCNPLRTPKENWPNVEKFLKTLGLRKKSLVLAEQVHGNLVLKVSLKDRGKIVPGVDALLTGEKGVILGLHTADCLPLLFWEPEMKAVGVVHAGWPGVLKKIPLKMIDLIIRLGGMPKNIKIWVGPYIHPCCYEVQENLVDLFTQKFGDIKGMTLKKEKKTFLDLKVPTEKMLVNSGIKEKNITFTSLCTGCHPDLYSRRMGDRGSLLGVIGLIN